MTNQVSIVENAGAIMEAVIARGDLAQLKPDERAKYYTRVCESIGLNPLTKPFEYIILNGKLTLYARKETTDQLRKIYGVSVLNMTEVREDGLVIVTVKVRDQTGRTDMAKGAVSLKGLQGEALANAIMKAETKAKRRATLSICGLGFLDESEVDDMMPDSVPRYTKTKQAAKDLYSALQQEVHMLTTSMQAKEWLDHNAERLRLLPRDWEDFLRTSCHDLITSDEPTEVWEDHEQPETAWDALGAVKQAGMLCGDEGFWKFLAENVGNCENADIAAKIVRGVCNVESRKELASNTAALAKWRQLVSDYRAWQREPEIVDQVSPRIVERPAVGSAGGERPQPPASPPTDEIDDGPTLAECDIALDEAAKKGSAALAKAWAETPKHHKPMLKAALDRRHKATAAQADALDALVGSKMEKKWTNG